MSLEVVFLGTAGSIPTIARSLPAIMIRRKGEFILFDCGENAQRQMINARLGFNKKMKVFVTHMHGDHILGLPGLIQTMSLLDRTKALEIYGPRGLEAFIEAIEEHVQFALKFPIEVVEIRDRGIVYSHKEYEIFAEWADHSIPAFAYSFVEKPRPGKFYPEKAEALCIPEGLLWSKLQQRLAVKLSNGRVVEPEEVVGPPRPGRKIVYTGDSRYSRVLVKFSMEADLLIHDCTFDDGLIERAKEDGHSTPSQAVKTAKKANVKRLILTHISARYRTPDLLFEQARKDFPKVEVARDLQKVSLPLPTIK
jgi:ribonuclease Z